MSESPAVDRHDEPITDVGVHVDDPPVRVQLPDGALDAGVYVEGPESPHQTALVHSWCVQWAEAGYGFMYVHPSGPEPRELLARLPDDRLDDVVWIDVHRERISSTLDVPALRRVTVDLFDVPEHDHEAFTVDPVNKRTSAYLDAFSEQDEFDWRVATVLSTILPAHFIRDDLDNGATNSAIELDGLESLCASHAPPDSEAERELAVIERAVEGVFDRESDAAREASGLITWLFDPYLQNPFLDDVSYDIGRAISEGHIVFVTGEDAFDVVLLRTRLLVAALCCRLIEAATIDGVDGPSFPVIFDGFAELAAAEDDLYRRLLRLRDRLPTVPVFSGPPAIAGQSMNLVKNLPRSDTDRVKMAITSDGGCLARPTGLTSSKGRGTFHDDERRYGGVSTA